MTPAALIATLLGIGRLKPAPGTWGSAAALGLGWLILGAGNALWLAGAIIAVTFAGTWAAGAYGQETGREDAGEVVIDEVAGQWIALLPLALMPAPAWAWLAAFALFRLFDIAKPWPVGWADRRIKGGWGVMCDDLLAGGMAALALWALLLLLA